MFSPADKLSRPGTKIGELTSEQAEIARLKQERARARCMQLLDEGVYLCSVSTMYQALRKNTQVRERRRVARHPKKTCPELVATAPHRVYSWDFPPRDYVQGGSPTKLAGPTKGKYFDGYVMIDIYSRYIVDVHAHAHESGVLARDLME